MKAIVGHVGINVSNEEESFDFWKSLLSFLEFELLPDGNHFDASDGHSYLCVQVTKPGYETPSFHRKRTGRIPRCLLRGPGPNQSRGSLRTIGHARLANSVVRRLGCDSAKSILFDKSILARQALGHAICKPQRPCRNHCQRRSGR